MHLSAMIDHIIISFFITGNIRRVCVHLIYRKYFANPCPENMPILEDLYNALLQQEEKEAHHVATALEIYVKGSLNLFNHRTNVNVNNRIVCYDIKELGKQMKKLGIPRLPEGTR